MSIYEGAQTSTEFKRRWRSGSQVGGSAPWCQVLVRRGRLERAWHDDWPDPQFGQIQGRSIHHQWYADWTVLDDYTELPGVQKIDLDQSFDKNGMTVLTLDADNVEWVEATGIAGIYHTRQRGFLWPWRGWSPPDRPGSGDAKNEWFERLPNAQILIRQGYGSDTAVKTFTGLIDNLSSEVRPDRMTITARDFLSVLTDCDVFGWNKDKAINDPITFIPEDYERRAWVEGDGKTHRWVIIKDSVEIVKCCLRWLGFKEWEVEDSGVNLSVPYTVDKSKTFMDVINAVKEQLGYVFFMGEPTDDDVSIGVPVFRRSSVCIPSRSQPITVRDRDLLTDFKPQRNNAEERYVIRVRGAVNSKVGRTLFGDTTKRVTFTYYPSWRNAMSGVLKQLTYYNIGDKGSIGFKTVQQCAVACVLIAIQIALARATATFQTPGNPAFGLDGFAFVTDAGSGVASRVYITNRKSIMRRGGDGGSSSASSGGNNDLIWATEVGGSLVDYPAFEILTNDYLRATTGQVVNGFGINF